MSDRLLITGVNGQDGTYLVDNAKTKGMQCHGIVLDSENLSPFLDLESVTIHKGSINDRDFLERIVRLVNPTHIYHLAAQSSVAKSWSEPSQTFETNLLATYSLLNIVSQYASNAKLVIAGSSEMFLQTAPLPWDESTPITANSPYGTSKAGAFLLAKTYRDLGLNISTAILFNHESSRRPTHFLTRKIVIGAVGIYLGEVDFMELGDLSLRRDWGYAPEYVEAIQQIIKLDVLEDFVLCSGQPISVLDFAKSSLRALGIDNGNDYIRSNAEFIRQMDAPIIQGNASRAKEALNWQAEVFGEELARVLTLQELSRRTENLHKNK